MAFSFALFELLQAVMPKLPKSDNPEPSNRQFRDYPRIGHARNDAIVPLADVGCLAASSAWMALRAIANCGWSCYAALTVSAEELLRMNESIHGERTATEPQD